MGLNTLCLLENEADVSLPSWSSYQKTANYNRGHRGKEQGLMKGRHQGDVTGVEIYKV